MNAFDHYSVLIQQLSQHWNIACDPPVKECSTHFTTGNEGDIMLRLSDDESVIVVGLSLPLSTLSDAPVEDHALQQFLLQRVYAARMDSLVRCAWLQEDNRIAMVRGIEAGTATVEGVLAVIDNLDARFDALKSVTPVFHGPGRPLPGPMDVANYV